MAVEEQQQAGLDAALAALTEPLERRVGAGRAPLVADFARAFLRRANDPLTGDPEALAAEVAGAFALADARGHAPAAVRAFTPTEVEHGYHTGGSVLETNTPDLPFLVDSVSAELRDRGIGIRRVVHPIVGTERDRAGRVTAIAHPNGATLRESVMHFELQRQLPPEQLAALEDAIRAVLAAVREVVDDFEPMLAAVDRMVELAQAAAPHRPEDEIAETIAFLRWLCDNHFVLLGYRDYDFVDGRLRVDPDSGLGLLRRSGDSTFAQPVPLEQLSPTLQERQSADAEHELLLIDRTNRRSPIHRRERMDDITLRKLGPDGAPRGEARLLGLFTSRAYAEPASRTPLLGHKLRRVLEAEDLIPGSHDHKAAIALFNSFPTDELLNVGVDDLRRAIVALLGVQGDDVRLLGRRHHDGRAASLIASLPRARATVTLRKELPKRLAQRFGGADVQVQEVLDENDRMRLHYTVHKPEGTLPEVRFAELQDTLLELARTWEDRTREQLVAAHGTERGQMLAARWLERFPDSYKALVDPRDAVADVRAFDELLAAGDRIAVDLADERRAGGMTRVKIYSADGKVELSSVVPLLEHLGLRIIEERPTRMIRRSAGETWLQDFGVLGPGAAPLDLADCGQRTADVLRASLRGTAESDSLNRLVVLACLDGRQVAILRAYRAYRQRIGSRFTESYQNDVIAANAQITAKIVRLFELKFDPAQAGSDEAFEGLRREILDDLDGVASLDHDRILRNQLGLIDATVRTNAYVPDRPVLAFKLRSADVPAIPTPAPLFEIYVHSQHVEGIHLRGGLIARGGIRWSDRMDYRTEVFGLMRAQMTKNAVIVPAGSKGGFYLRRRPTDPVALRDEVRRRYVDYISGLLDVTDNRVEGETVHPRDVRVHDGDDAYLVVAADKGTASFSDTANAVAESRRFWLGDAFASGGSKGYDHKALGITARGAWTSLERHFRELGLDPAKDEFTAVGIGDMSGDVFGNGMLCSDRIRLVAVYDHRHIFIDPNPDPAVSFEERRRLFERPRSCWDDYDRTLISAGGGVWPRSAKSIPLSPEARTALGIDEAELVPSELIRAVLRAPVDVLWNGGIGTVVKASTESDDDAADRASDAIRVDARDLRVRVIAEGGNLGLTQRARVEFSRRGGRVNADFIDNSGGVDCSDHEVNLKILLGLAVERGELTSSERDEQLRAVTDDVCAHVLRDSRLQAAMLEREARQGAERVLAYDDLLTELERAGEIDRARDVLPGVEELAERRRQGRGLERPELAVLLAHGKITLTDELMESELIDDPWLAEQDLRAYFPDPIVERFGHLLADHPLRRELVAMVAANDCVDALDPTFVSRLCAERGARPPEVVRAYRIARAVCGADERWRAIGRLDRALDRESFWELVAGVDWMVEALTRWYLAAAPPGPLAPIVEGDRPAFERLAASIHELGPPDWGEGHEQTARRLVDAGVPEAVAHRHAFQPSLVHAPDVTAVARACGRAVEDVMWTFQLLGGAVQINWLEQRLLALPATSRSQGWALRTVLDDLLRARRDLAAAALREAAADAPPEAAVEAFLASRTDARDRLRRFVRSTLAVDVDLPGLMLAARHLRAVADES